MKRDVTENFDRPVIRLLPWVFIVVTLLSAGNINAESLIKSKSFPVMETRRYAFMDSITSYIKDTDMEAVYQICTENDNSDFVKRDYIYDLYILRANTKTNRYEFSSNASEEVINFSSDGSYRITIGTYAILPDEFSYIFEYNGLTFFCSFKHWNFIIRQCKTKKYKYYFNRGADFYWCFIIDKGRVSKAYALYGTCENPRYAYDLKSGCIIPYSEFDTSFYNINHQCYKE